jgi:hypothetical protein
MTTYGFKEEDIFPYFRGIPGTKTSSSRYPDPVSAYIYSVERHWKYKNIIDSAKGKFPPYFVWVTSGTKNFPASYSRETHKQMGKEEFYQYCRQFKGKTMSCSIYCFG